VNLCSLSRENREIVFAGQKVDEKVCIVKCAISMVDNSPKATFTVLKAACADGESVSFPKEIVSVPKPMTVQGRTGDVHIIFYPPKNPEYSGSNIEGERPPCVVHVHGGPTGFQKPALDWKKQYFTSRGWAWMDVNYGGSAGYGRAYIERLAGKWGIVDVDDCISAANMVSSAPHNLVDPKRIVICGGSAGGWTVLCALSYGRDLHAFAAGTSSYGVTDLKPFVEHTHKFESKYLEKLVGGTYAEVPELYKERSPVTHAKKIAVPLLILQGEIDKVVPKEQADKLYELVKPGGGVVEYKVYPGEGHGWRQEKNIKDALETEIGFYERVFGMKN